MLKKLSDSITEFKGKKLIEKYEPCKLFDKDISTFINSMEDKEIYQESGNYVIVTEELVKSLSEHLKNKKVLEVMSGTGLLAWHLKENGVDILATDSGSWNLKEVEPNFVKKIDAIDAINKYQSAEIILMCWPYMDDTAYKVLKALLPHQILICCGEINGCTANKDFWDNYDYKYMDSIKYNSFFGIKDYFFEGKLKNE